MNLAVYYAKRLRDALFPPAKLQDLIAYNLMLGKYSYRFERTHEQILHSIARQTRADKTLH